jgi:hypothetical protein
VAGRRAGSAGGQRTPLGGGGSSGRPRAGRPVGHWEHERDTYEARIVTDTPEFERGRERGRRLSLEQAIDEALAMSSVPEAGQTSMHTDDGT